MTEDVQVLIEKMAADILLSTPDDFPWERIEFANGVVGENSQAECYTVFEGTETFLLLDFSSSEYRLLDLPFELREAMYKQAPEKGAWYTMKMTITKDGKFSVSFDYENQPAFYSLEDADYIEDHQNFPCDEKFVPAWLREILERKA